MQQSTWLKLQQQQPPFPSLRICNKQHCNNVGGLLLGFPLSHGFAYALSQALSRAVQQATGRAGVRVRQNNGPAAGQVVPQLHFHVIPTESPEDEVSRVPGLGFARFLQVLVAFLQAETLYSCGVSSGGSLVGGRATGALLGRWCRSCTSTLSLQSHLGMRWVSLLIPRGASVVCSGGSVVSKSLPLGEHGSAKTRHYSCAATPSRSVITGL